MANNRWHPRREAMAQMLARAFPIPHDDKEEQTERELVQRIEIREARK